MTQRHLHIAAYDISSDERLREALRVLKEYASGRQKSVFECFLSAAEESELHCRVRAILDPRADRFVLIRLDPRGKIRVRGRAVKPTDPPYFLIG